MLETLETTDFDEISAAQSDWELHHQPVRPDKFKAQLSIGYIGCIQVDLEQWSNALEITGTPPEQSLGLVLPLDNGSYISEGCEVTSDRIDTFVPGGEVHVVTSQQTSLISCTIPLEALEDRIDLPAAVQLAELATKHTVIRSTMQATADLRRWWSNLLALSAQNSIPPEALDLLLDETLLVTARALTPGDEERGTGVRQRYLLARRTRDYMLERHINPPTITELCTHLKVSERTLHYAFSRTYGVSPKRFLKARRLHAVHQALKTAVPEEHVQDIAMQQGFWDLGYFARDYRNMFGELPSVTLRDHRQ